MTVAGERTPGQRGAHRRPVVLVVDDDDFQHKIIELILGPEHYDLHFLANAEQVLAWLEATRADLVLVDLQMPVMDGLELTRRLRASAVAADIPVLMMSGQGDTAMVLRCLDAGAQDFVAKPFVRAGLQATVAQLLAKDAKLPAGAAELAHPGINVERGLSAWGTLEDYRLFLRKFAMTYADGVDRLRDCYVRQDGDAARSLAHKMRGAAGTMALDDVANCAGALEMLAADQDPLPLLLQLESALETALASITAYADAKAV